jgi:hypothetical protein
MTLSIRSGTRSLQRSFAPGWIPYEQSTPRRELRPLTGPLRTIIEQYTVLPKSIVELLMEARDRVRAALREAGSEGGRTFSPDEVNALHATEAELVRNIGQELGSETQGLPHYHMLVEGLTAYSITSARTGIPEPNSTGAFMATMFDLLSGPHDLLFSLGGIYALENTAVPELRIVRTLVLSVFSPDLHDAASAEAARGLQGFFQRHLEDWEPSHRDTLYACVAPLVRQSAARAQFEQGFRTVLGAMDRWWQNLAAMIERSPLSHEDYLRTLTRVREQRYVTEKIDFELGSKEPQRLLVAALARPALFGPRAFPILVADIRPGVAGTYTDTLQVASAVVLDSPQMTANDISCPLAEDLRKKIADPTVNGLARLWFQSWQGSRPGVLAAARPRVIDTWVFVMAATLAYGDPETTLPVGFYCTLSARRLLDKLAPIEPTASHIQTAAERMFPRELLGDYTLREPKIVQKVWVIAAEEAPALTDSGCSMLENLLSEIANENWEHRARLAEESVRLARESARLAEDSRARIAEQAENAAHDVKGYTSMIHSMLVRSRNQTRVEDAMALVSRAADLIALMSALSMWNVEIFRRRKDKNKDAKPIVEPSAHPEQRRELFELTAHLLVDLLGSAPREGVGSASGYQVLRRSVTQSLVGERAEALALSAAPASEVVETRMRELIRTLTGKPLSPIWPGRVLVVQNDRFATFVTHLLREAIWNMRLPETGEGDLEIGIEHSAPCTDDEDCITINLYQRFKSRKKLELDAVTMNGILTVDATYGFAPGGLRLGRIERPAEFYSWNEQERLYLVVIRTQVRTSIRGRKDNEGPPTGDGRDQR